MELKDYQLKALSQVKQYLELLADWRRQAAEVKKTTKGKVSVDFPKEAWEQLKNGRSFFSHKNGLGEYLPHFCLKIPTGGGKTLLAVKAIDVMNTVYRGKRTGLILWVVPTAQIYRQTLRALRDKEHCYRQHLDIASGGRTLVLEKTERFTPLDMEENLCVLLLMLPSASRQSKETLRMFRDSGGFGEFFPPEDNREEQARLLKEVPNLDVYEDATGGLFGRQIKTSLGNTLRLLAPVIILDEGHKAYSDLAQQTLRGFNPSLLLELSATPPEGSNNLVEIYGTELNREGMIKLDLHIARKASAQWEDTLTASVARREELEHVAAKHRTRTGTYIRPICLIQVERTGREQRGTGLVHAEDVRERLIKVHVIPPDQIAVKTSEKDELRDVDDTGGLLHPDCPVRYIITKHALQEGWDCSFAYVLTVLTNPSSKNALTQLVGRILRQPYARKTGVPALDESYVFCFQRRGDDLLRQVQQGFKEEGLGDLHGRVTLDEGMDSRAAGVTEKTAVIRPTFRRAAEHVILPVFVMREDEGWRPVDVQADIESRISWESVNVDALCRLPLGERDDRDTEHNVTLSEDLRQLVEQKNLVRLRDGTVHADAVFFTRHLLDAVPNPWIAFDIGQRMLRALVEKHGEKNVSRNFVFLIERARMHLAQERDRLAREVFKRLIEENALQFLIIGNRIGFRFPEKRKEKSTQWLNREDGSPLQRSLFDPVPSEDFNGMERQVAQYLDGHDRLFFWYRNISRQDYAVQGWRRHKIYPDFIFTTAKDEKAFDKVFLIETKGEHLLGSDDTAYKQSVFGLCNVLAKESSFSELGLRFHDVPFRFEVIPGNEWEEQLQALLLT